MSKLNLTAFHLRLSTRRLGRAFILLPTCGSTNDEIILRANQGHEEGLVIAAHQQTAGRGRRGRIWHSPDEGTLYFSLLLRPACSPLAASPVPLLVAVVLAQVLVTMGFEPRLKWPNDVLLPTAHGLCKVAGILTELTCHGGEVRHLTLGVGINVGGRQFPPELAPKVTSLWLCNRQDFEGSQILATFLNSFEPAYSQFLSEGPKACLDEYRTYAHFGQACYTEQNGVRHEGIAENVDAEGALILRKLDGTSISIHAGEVHWVNSL
jgi:BirA family biotin operon repressor/biotin-[acetyl-CoA-carboxylase] ligase